jgi:U3 small nucleolar RNA-associated protein 4
MLDLFPFKAGARLVQFSPDAKWLFIVDNNSQVFTVRIVHRDEQQCGADSADHLTVHPRVMKLKRLDRRHGEPKANLVGALGNYDRVINRLAISSDSRIAVVGDLSGYLDSWVLRGYGGDAQPDGAEVESDDSSSNPSLSEGDSHRGVEDTRFILDQRWIRNPSASLLPKLTSAPIVLSFRPSLSAGAPQLNSNMVAHPTRHNPHPYSHDLPVGEDRLFVLTAEHQMYEFEVLKGRLSAWSRRNPTKNLPETFRRTRARAMGCVWDIKAGRECLWLYGSSWLWMFDLSRDFLSTSDDRLMNEENKKRKRDEDDLRKGTSGAGSKIRDSELETGTGRKIRRITRSGQEEEQEWMSLQSPQDSDGEGDEDGQEVSALAKLRLEIGEGGDDDNSVQGAEAAKRPDIPGQSPSQTAWWSTYKYRPIMGIVPIGYAHDDASGEGLAEAGGAHLGEGLLEVVLVERPLWDVDLPPRYYGDQEWVK